MDLIGNNIHIAKKRGIRTEGEYLMLWHGTNTANAKKITKQHRFKAGTWFAADQETAMKYARMAGGKPQLMMVFIHAGSVLPSGDYWTSQADLIEEPMKLNFFKAKVVESIMMFEEFSEYSMARHDLDVMMKSIRQNFRLNNFDVIDSAADTNMMIAWLEPGQKQKFEEYLKALKKKRSEEGVVIMWDTLPQEFGDYFRIYVRRMFNKPIIPKRFIYHTSSPANRDKIEKDGLQPSTGNWGPPIEYLPAVFAVNSPEKDLWFNFHSGKDVWEIDTAKYDGGWFEDSALENSIYTKGPVPPAALRLVHDGNFGKDINFFLFESRSFSLKDGEIKWIDLPETVRNDIAENVYEDRSLLITQGS